MPSFSKIDLHIHSKDCSDGKMTLEEIFAEISKRGIRLVSITDHDSIDCQERAKTLAMSHNVHYITGVELNIRFEYGKKSVSLDILGYGFDINDQRLKQRLKELREYRKLRAKKILEKLNYELVKDGFAPFTYKDIELIENRADGSLGRPHIADYMIEKGIVRSRKEAFERYLIKCDVPKMPLSLEEASSLIRGAGGKAVLAHPNNPSGTSLYTITSSVEEQFKIIEEKMLPYLDGIECWHSKHDPNTVSSYLEFAKRHKLLVTGGSDCHQQPVILGTVKVPLIVAEQFGIKISEITS